MNTDVCPFLYQNCQNENEFLCDLGTGQICMNWKKRHPVTRRHIYTEIYICPESPKPEDKI